MEKFGGNRASTITRSAKVVPAKDIVNYPELPQRAKVTLNQEAIAKWKAFDMSKLKEPRNEPPPTPPLRSHKKQVIVSSFPVTRHNTFINNNEDDIPNVNDFENYDDDAASVRSYFSD